MQPFRRLFFGLVFVLSTAPGLHAETITGTVTGPGGSTLENSVDVSAYEWNGSYWQWVRSVSTDGVGAFDLGGLSAGTYRIAYEDFSNNYLTEYYDNAADLDSATDLILGGTETVSNINASLDFSSHITGTVTGSDGTTPLTGINVSVHAWNSTWSYWEWIGADSTDPIGNYDVGGLVARTYRVQFQDYFGPYLWEVYNDAPDFESGTDIPVGPGETVTDINASLFEGSHITGTVTGPDGTTPLENVDVHAYRWNSTYSNWQYVGFAGTDALGMYDIGRLPSDTYRVHFWAYMTPYLQEAYDNVPSLDFGTDVFVGPTSTVSGIDASLGLPGSVSGTVTESDGLTPISGIGILVEDPATGISGWGETAETGFYSVNGLWPTNYYVRTDLASRSRYIPQWYDGITKVPGSNMPPPAASPIAVSGGTVFSNVNFSLDRGGVLTGTTTGFGGLPIGGANITVQNGATFFQHYATRSANDGLYEIRGIFPDTYQVKASAGALKDEWWNNVNHIDLATPIVFAAGDEFVMDFDLEPGQSPAMVEITSDPSGADVFIDYQATALQTPVTVDIGEVASRAIGLQTATAVDMPGVASRSLRLQAHPVSVKKTGYAWPSPRPANGIEAETVNVHFDLISPVTASVEVVTTPSGAAVYVNSADAPIGMSPVTVGNLIPGSHTVLLQSAGYLQPKPVQVHAETGTPFQVDVPLTLAPSANAGMVDVRTVPPEADVLVNYLAPAQTSDFVTELLDPASHEGAGWHSREHVLLVRKAGYLASAPREVEAGSNSYAMVVVVLIEDETATTDLDEDGLADEWEDAYDLNTLAPGEDGATDDPDMDGMTNEEEKAAGTDPLDPDSVIAGSASSDVTPDGQLFRYVFDSVPGRYYIVQCSDDLNDPDGWRNVSGIITATGYRTEYVNVIPAGLAGRNYRVLAIGQ